MPRSRDVKQQLIDVALEFRLAMIAADSGNDDALRSRLAADMHMNGGSTLGADYRAIESGAGKQQRRLADIASL
jgi:hypothetical protein